jgi:hypothetical protein
MAAIQKGTTLLISFGSFVYTGYVAEDITVSYPDGNVEVIKNADGATMTKIFMDPSTKIDATVVILSGTGQADPPIDGAAVGIIPPKGTLTTFMSMGSSSKFAAGATRLSLALVKENSMTYT